MATGKPWLKLWTEIRNDQKLRRVDPAWRWCWVSLLCMARENGDDGRLAVLDDPMSDYEIADGAGVSMEVWTQAKAYFVRMDMLVQDGDTLMVVNFKKRQEASDPTGAVRQSRYRNRDKDKDNDESNASRNASRNAQEYREQKTEDREQKTEERPTDSVASPTPLAAGDEAPTNGKSARFVDPSVFLSQIGFKNPDSLLRQETETLVAKWAFYYSCLNDTQRKAVQSWPPLVNDRVRNNKAPRLTDEQSTRFYRDWGNS